MSTRLTRNAFRRVLAAASVVICLGVASCGDDSGGDDASPSTGSTEAPTTTAPSFEVTGTDFYAPPDPLPEGEHGDLIWAEPIEQWWGSPRRAWRVLYRSESLTGDPIAVSWYGIAPAEPGDDGELPCLAWSHETGRPVERR